MKAKQNELKICAFHCMVNKSDFQERSLEEKNAQIKEYETKQKIDFCSFLWVNSEQEHKNQEGSLRKLHYI